jgi:hypothetical protein
VKITEEWRMYDPKDQRTHPEGIATIEMEFDDNLLIQGHYSRDLGMFSQTGQRPIGSRTPVRWRYIEENPEPLT